MDRKDDGSSLSLEYQNGTGFVLDPNKQPSSSAGREL
jgi:hypothetical protein